MLLRVVFGGLSDSHTSAFDIHNNTARIVRKCYRWCLPTVGKLAWPYFTFELQKAIATQGLTVRPRTGQEDLSALKHKWQNAERWLNLPGADSRSHARAVPSLRKRDTNPSDPGAGRFSRPFLHHTSFITHLSNNARGG